MENKNQDQKKYYVLRNQKTNELLGVIEAGNEIEAQDIAVSDFDICISDLNEIWELIEISKDVKQRFESSASNEEILSLIARR
ncbi:hypothetical protein DRH29_04580 [candidate division Kazan bacterium]|uniref:Uncharacterized protein n=1 Tax=candidate division Kazan bacterium TaxID=2202143 RepID=A0A420ZBS1_UNCK3|nr:MAG: hypothetical protein DRH29_04580 [candidate division Kazan bacterium]